MTMISHGQPNSALNTAFNMAHQTAGNTAKLTRLSLEPDIKDPEVEEKDDDMPQSLEEALLGE